MTAPAMAFSADETAELVGVAFQPGYRRWLEMVRSTGECADPMHLSGCSSLIDQASGETLSSHRTANEPNSELLVVCRNRRASRCVSCAETYRADTCHLIRAGLGGSKNVPDAVAQQPRVFATCTAPGFGPVHHRVVERLGVSLHAQGMISACLRFGGLPELGGLRRRPSAHMLGFRGHFSTKSRRYFTTLRCLRQARQAWGNNRLAAALDYPEDTDVQWHQAHDRTFGRDRDTVLVVGQWWYRGRGHSPGEAIYARTIADDLAKNRSICRHFREEAA
jgi:hypothetical protein